MDGEARVICEACGGTYPVFDGIPSFVAPTLPSPNLGARGMTVDAVEVV